MRKRTISLFLALAALLAFCAFPAQAKTISSAKADNLFFYATNTEGKSVLLKVMPLAELKQLAHGQADGRNYYISTTDNYPTTQYCEARGFTVMELLEHIQKVSDVPGAEAIGFSGEDTIRLMATDSYGNYSRSWTADQLYGVPRYYFEGLYDSEHGWKTAWEIAGEDSSKFGLALDDYNSAYADSDPYFEDKRAVFSGGVETTVVLATESYSGRTTSETLTASTEPGLAGYIRDNGGVVAGCLSKALTDEYALRLSLPMTEADLMTAHRTAYDNFKWIYNIRLDMANAPAIESQGTVAEPVPSFSLDGNTLSVAFSCETPGASIYYGDDGAPQTLYTGPVTIDVSGRDLDAEPVTVYATAVREGWDDAGILTFKYPGMAPAFKTVYSGMTNQPLTFEAADGVGTADWTAWTDAILFVSMKAPDTTGYATLDASSYSVDSTARTVTFDASLFPQTGSYSFVFHAAKYANKNLSVTMKQGAPPLSAESSYSFGSAVTVFFDDPDYNNGLSVYVTPENGNRTMISASYLDRTQPGSVIIREEYFALDSSAMSSPGRYTLELTNNSFSPASQTIEIQLTMAFSDVPSDAWYYSYVTKLANVGVISGMGDGSFAPDGTLTWGQAMKLLLLAAGFDDQPPTGAHWASGYMDRAASEGWISADADPDAEITRLQFCQSAAKAVQAETTLSASPFTDTDDPAVLALVELGIINGMGDGIFAPDATLTRAQISKIIYLMMELEG